MWGTLCPNPSGPHPIHAAVAVTHKCPQLGSLSILHTARPLHNLFAEVYEPSTCGEIAPRPGRIHRVARALGTGVDDVPDKELTMGFVEVADQNRAVGKNLGHVLLGREDGGKELL